MTEIKKIFPAGLDTSPLHTLKIILLAEGYRAADRPQFAAACSDFVAFLSRTAPFSLMDINPYSISVHAGFVASGAAGAAVDAPANNRTAFDASYDTAAHQLSISQSKFNAFVEDATTTLTVENTDVQLAEVLCKGDLTVGTSGATVALLLPPISGEPATAETESVLGADDYHFVACSTNNFWHQVVLRTIGAVMGLGDEWELDGNDFLAPAKPKDVLYVNLQYYDAPPTTHQTGKLNWRDYLSLADRIQPPVVHPKVNPAAADNTIDAVPMTPSTIEYWEGAAGYRTKVYRSAHDCLMRRRIGDGRLPVSAGRVPFCKVCRQHLKNLLF
jgi:hypothetical protein